MFTSSGVSQTFSFEVWKEHKPMEFYSKYQARATTQYVIQDEKYRCEALPKAFHEMQWEKFM